jgi:opacity protein-like surface antigen
MIKVLTTISTLAFLYSTHLSASQENHFYIAADAGIFTANFNSSYLDLSDIIPQNITQSINQNDYTGGIALGYSRTLSPVYFLGVEVSANVDGGSALFQSGAANSAFSDAIKINNHYDLVVVPGLSLSTTISSYLKLGLSRAHIENILNSPVGYEPRFMEYGSNQTVNGFAAGIGVRRSLGDRVTVFAEYNYHDYGTVNFSNFQNFTANYSHSARIYTYAGVIGAAYNFNC